LGKRRTEIAGARDVAELSALAEEAVELASAVEKEPITIVCSQKSWCARSRGTRRKTRRSNIVKVTATVSGFMPSPPTG